MKHIPLKQISLKNHPRLNEKWLQDVIESDPGILGLGDVVVKDRERIHSGAGRLDLLLQDADGYGRYEREIKDKRDFLKELLKAAYDRRNGA